MIDRRQSGNLWGMLVWTVFLIMLASAILMAFMAGIIIQLGWVNFTRFHALWPIIFAMVSSILIGTGITAMVGRKILAPITDLSEAAKEVAKGNFKVRLKKETHRVRALGEMAANFNKMVHELNGIETLRNDFIANVSHEFKTPIAAIEGYAALMQDEDLTAEERREYSRLIIESTRQLSSLSANMLKLSKLENQEFVLEKHEFDLDEQIRHALLLLEVQWSEKMLNLDIALDNVRFYGNEDLLMQVWLNLLGNAIKFSDEGGEIAVYLSAGPSSVQVRIADTGIGMNAVVLEHIFEKFYQGDKSRAGEGNGLGLALVKRIVDLCGGEIGVESEPGAGSVFTVTLPVDKA
ncbi:cell wall metabolism sensor histidine kinase WalK [Paenibacillus sp. YN15]|uniref:sensor histidine kinase n=1 Tax=Paenibacillus sp. YN15 TaxID=1742774 RepID=UPI00215D07B2|nr:HAMP domain-containing sensor histidine kinase [Paenibacillus sp. YN15]